MFLKKLDVLPFKIPCRVCGKYTYDSTCEYCFEKAVEKNPSLAEDGAGNDYSGEYDF